MASEAETRGNAAAEAAQKTPTVYTMLENNPEIMNELALQLGVSADFAFHDVYSLYDADVMAMVPRPVHALLVTIPMSDAWRKDRNAEDAGKEWYKGAGSKEPIFWMKQTVIHGCGLIGLIHCAINGLPSDKITPGSKLAKFRDAAVPLHMDERAKLLNDDKLLHEASEAVAFKGDTRALRPDEDSPHHFIAFVKGADGNLWELEGSRKGPLNRGSLGDDDDAFSERALDLGFRRVIELQREAGEDLPFSCIALAPSSG